jgi:dihydroorotate dehydrogenase (fumarate)
MTMSPDLGTTYLGFRLPHPFLVGASPLVDHLDTVRRLEDAGCSAIVMHSLFEEQITAAENGRIHHLDPLNKQFATVLSYFPEPEQYALDPDHYLEQLRKIKSAVAIPVIASLNGTTAETWLRFAQNMQQAGADAIELNIYDVVTDPMQSAAAIEHELSQVTQTLKRALTIPIAVKLSPFFTAFGHVAHELDRAGADALVLFNRFYEPDFDINTLTVTPHIELSTSSELLLRLQWAAILHGRVRSSLAVCGGVAHPNDGIKAVLAGLGDVRGRLSLASSPDPSVFERANYIRTLSSWTTAEQKKPPKEVPHQPGGSLR